MTVLEHVIRTAKASGKKSHELAMLSDTSDSWIRMLLSGKMQNPSLDRLERLYTGLTGKSIVPDNAE